MNIGFISDLHIDNFTYEPTDYIKELSKLIEELQLRRLIIGGDISNHYSTTIQFVEDLQNTSKIPVHFIPGNHDFWDRSKAKDDIDTLEIYNIYKNHPQCLIESPLMLTDKVGLVGHTAWYNYHSYNKEKFTLEQITKGKYKGVTWQDMKYIRWALSDQDMSKKFAEVVEEDILKLGAEELILVTHMVTIPEFTMKLPHRVFDFFNAYIATNDFDSIYNQYPIKYSVMGHIHFRTTLVKEDCTFISNSLGYVKEWRSNNMYAELKHALQVIQL